MENLKLDLWTCDIGAPATGPADFAELVIRRVTESWDAGADVVVFPEFTWMALERFVAGPEKLAGVAHLFWNTLWPDLRTHLNRNDKAAVLGTVPFPAADGGFHNRAPIMSEGTFSHQDKIHLTPWEHDFIGGGPVRIWKFRGWNLAVVICLDVEIPELSAALRGRDIDLMLVPSATENVLGVERVGRCADARSVELGCYVGLCHLVGKAVSELVDENMGQLASFSPSQSPLANSQRRSPGELFTGGFHRRSITLDMNALAQARNLPMETNPSRLVAIPITVETA